jgi:hypothetical protein
MNKVQNEREESKTEVFINAFYSPLLDRPVN